MDTLNSNYSIYLKELYTMYNMFLMLLFSLVNTIISVEFPRPIQITVYIWKSCERQNCIASHNSFKYIL